MVAAPAAGASRPAPASPVAHTAACRAAVIGGKHVCLAAGRRCSPRYQRQYLRHKFSCGRANGRYRLVANKQSF